MTFLFMFNYLTLIYAKSHTKLCLKFRFCKLTNLRTFWSKSKFLGWNLMGHNLFSRAVVWDFKKVRYQNPSKLLNIAEFRHHFLMRYLYRLAYNFHFWTYIIKKWKWEIKVQLHQSSFNPSLNFHLILIIVQLFKIHTFWPRKTKQVKPSNPRWVQTEILLIS